MISRRGMLAGLAAGAALAAWRVGNVSAEDAVIEVLRRRLHYLQLNADGLKAFARDLIASQSISATKIRIAGAAGLLIPAPTSTAGLSMMLRAGEEHIVSVYLLSSSFFRSGSDVGKTIEYLGYYDPHQHPCGNPFARFEDEPG